MSDTSQGPGWWQASDGKWYPPEQQPGYQPDQAGQPAGGGAGGGGTDLGSTLSYAFNKFIQNIGDWLVLWLILVGVFILASILITVVVVGASAGGFTFNFLGIILWAVVGAAIGCVYVAIAKAANMAVLGQKIDIGAAFKLSSNNLIAGATFGVLFGVLNSFCWILGLVVFLFLGFVPVLSAMYDKGFEAFGESVNLTTSNPGETMVFWLIAGFFASICGLGAPIAMIGGAYLVKRYKGEDVAPTN